MSRDRYEKQIAVSDEEFHESAGPSPRVPEAAPLELDGSSQAARQAPQVRLSKRAKRFSFFIKGEAHFCGADGVSIIDNSLTIPAPPRKSVLA